jgi:hypothetical protein
MSMMEDEIDGRIEQIVEARIRERQLKLKESKSIDAAMPGS